MNDPVNRTMLLVDIERFSDRDDVEQAFLRRMLYDVVDRTMERAGIDETLRLRADQGDSVMEFIDPNVSVPQLLRSVVSELPAQLRAVNRMASSAAQMRLRAVVATGFIALDERGIWVGSDLNHACRLLDADLLRAALRERPGDVALCVSQSVYAGIVRHDHPGIPAEEFHEAILATKNGPLPAWLLGPVPAPGQAAPAAQPPAGVHFTGGAPVFGGSFVMGDQHGVSGGRVVGDVVMGGAGGLPRSARTSGGPAPEQDGPAPEQTGTGPDTAGPRARRSPGASGDAGEGAPR
ncbi:hypothetical protein [Streptomyces diastaticus]